MKYFVINGQGGSGKDSFVNMVRQKHVNGNVFNISSIHPIKEIAKSGGWLGSKTDKDRKMLSDLKNIFIEYNNLPIKYIMDKISFMGADDIMFIHIRESTEMDKLKKLLPSVKTVLIDRYVEEKGNDSDDMVYDYQYDIIIDNDGSIDDLKDAAEIFIQSELIDEKL